MKVKLILTKDFYDRDDDAFKVIANVIPEQEFEEVTKKEYQLLLDNLYNIPKPVDSYDVYWNIIALDDEKVKNRIQSVRKILDEQIKKKEEDKKKREKQPKRKEKKKQLKDQRKKN